MVKIGEIEETFGKNLFPKKPAFLGENELSRARRSRKPLKTAYLCFGKSRPIVENNEKTRYFERQIKSSENIMDREWLDESGRGCTQAPLSKERGEIYFPTRFLAPNPSRRS
jgi:hypothetical protein